MKVSKVREAEQKFLIHSVNKTSLWEKEFIIYQWYEDNITGAYENKLKIIFDILNLKTKFVRVEKQRNDLYSSEKTIHYLDIKNLDISTLYMKPFIAKRRSIKENFYLDYFLNSNNKCEYLLEIENMDMGDIDLTNFSEFKIFRNVTIDESYHNRNMAVNFTESNLKEFQLILKTFKL